MKQAIIMCPAVWTELTQVGDGSTYFITNNGSDDILYSVSDKPAEDEEGFIRNSGSSNGTFHECLWR